MYISSALCGLSLFFLLPLSTTAETVLGVYIFSRHGDRTSKSTPPTNLTTLGYSQIFSSGSYFRSRYISSDASSPIFGISPDLVDYEQISASAPLDTVLMPSAQGFLQGLYPPVGSQLGRQKLRNESEVQGPLDGYQLIPIQTVTTGTASEDSAWLQGAGNCANAISSSNDYFSSLDYQGLLESTEDFYNGLAPVVNATFSEDDLSYKNAYAIYDLVSVALTHNTSIPSSDLLTPSTLSRLSALASTHEHALAYNASSPVRAIAGSTLAAQVLQTLNATLVAPTQAPKINIQFGAYGSFMSFFGLTNLSSSSPSPSSVDFTGIPSYASTLIFELVTNSSVSGTDFPAPEDIGVRFLFHNGTASSTSTPTPYTLFAQPALTLPWPDFGRRMSAIAIGDQREWCRACGNSTGVCASTTSTSPTSGGEEEGGRGVSNAVAGIIGAFVTLAVVLGVEGLIIVAAGFRLVRKKSGHVRSEVEKVVE